RPSSTHGPMNAWSDGIRSKIISPSAISRLGPSPEARKSGCRVASAEGGLPCRTIRTSALTFEPVGGTHSRALLSAYGQQLRPGCPRPTSLPPPSSLNQLASPHLERLWDGQPRRL